MPSTHSLTDNDLVTLIKRIAVSNSSPEYKEHHIIIIIILRKNLLLAQPGFEPLISFSQQSTKVTVTHANASVYLLNCMNIVRNIVLYFKIG